MVSPVKVKITLDADTSYCIVCDKVRLEGSLVVMEGNASHRDSSIEYPLVAVMLKPGSLVTVSEYVKRPERRKPVLVLTDEGGN